MEQASWSRCHEHPQQHLCRLPSLPSKAARHGPRQPGQKQVCRARVPLAPGHWSAARLANASLERVNGADVLSGVVFLHDAENNKTQWGALLPHLPGSSALVGAAGAGAASSRYSCPPAARLEGWRVPVACISCLHCPQVTRKPEIWRLFPPSFIWQSPCLNCAHLADRQTGGSRARAGAGLCQPSIPAAWGHHQKVIEVLMVSVPGQHVLLSLAHSGTCWGLH